MKWNFYLIIDFCLFASKLPNHASKCTLSYSCSLDLPWDIAFTNNQHSCRYFLFPVAAVLLLPDTARLDTPGNFTWLYRPIYIAQRGSLWLASLFLWNWVVSPLHSDSLKSEKTAEELQTSYFTQVKIQQGNLGILPSTPLISLAELVTGFESNLQQAVILIHQL